MLSLFTKKLCPMLSLAIATVGCGKKISEANTGPSSSTEHQEPPSALVIKLAPSETKSLYTVPQNANIFLPDSLTVRSGNPVGRKITISYNLLSPTDSSYDYKCTYKGTSSAAVMPLEMCVNHLGEEFNDVSRFDFPVNYGRYIRLDLQGSAGLAIDAYYSAEWY